MKIHRNRPPRIVTCAEPGCAEQVSTTSNKQVYCPVHRAEHIRKAHNAWVQRNPTAERVRSTVERRRGSYELWQVVEPASYPGAFKVGATFSPEEIEQMERHAAFDDGMIIERGGVRKMAVREGRKQRLVEVKA